MQTFRPKARATYAEQSTNMTGEHSLLDFLDEEVVDKSGEKVGTLACFWESKPDRVAYYGVKTSEQAIVRVVPARFSTLDEYNSCIQVGFLASAIRAAPGWDCSMELDAWLQEKVHNHFGLVSAELHPNLKRHSPPSPDGCES